MQTIIISDIHGCIEEFNELLNITNYKFGDHVILLGDLLDRGNDSLGVVRKAREINAQCLVGNHELNYYKWLANKSSKLKKDYYSKLNKDDVLFLTHFSNYIIKDNFIFVHAGFKPNIPISIQRIEDITKTTFLNLRGQHLSLKRAKELGKKKAFYWTDFWTGPESIVFGHHAFSYKSPLMQMNVPGVMIYGLDNGCCFGGRLTALVLETREIFQVQAKRIYYERNTN